ncbi:IclR family transcriptional regulator [Streptomyces sp. NPDC048002]|uniref:IclR family transcriptional regulator n=1 Tax=Streptomyces sp. NPDC048002 TaxID=3154344 RepID=UPI0033F9D764
MTDLAKATAILNVLADGRRPLTLTELTFRTNLPRSTVHRVIRSLEEQFLVVHASDCPGYALGPGALKFGLNGHLMLVTANRPLAVSLSHELREHVGLAVFSGREMIMIDEVSPPGRPFELHHRLGRTADLHATATGRVLAARLSDDQMSRLLPHPLKRFTGRTVVDPDQLLADHANVRASGVAICLEEHDAGIGAAATCIPGETGVLLSIVVVLPVGRLLAKRESVIEALRRINPAVDAIRALRQLEARAAQCRTAERKPVQSSLTIHQRETTARPSRTKPQVAPASQ